MRSRGCWYGRARAAPPWVLMPSNAQTFGQRLTVFRRSATDHLATAAALGMTLLVIAPLLAIFGYLLYRGAGALTWSFLTQTPKPVGEAGGGMANAIVGSGVILAIASAIGVPIGIGAGIYLVEFSRNRFGDFVRFTADVLNGVPSIVMGIAVYALVV